MTGLEHRGIDILLGPDHYWEYIIGKIHRQRKLDCSAARIRMGGSGTKRVKLPGY